VTYGSKGVHRLGFCSPLVPMLDLLIDQQIAKLNGIIAQAMKPHQDAVIRLAEVPGLRVDSAQQNELGYIRAGATVDVVSDDVREGTCVPRKAYSMCGGEG
jgi:hypothetical protein